MFFWLKKAVAFWLMPLPLSLGLMAAGLFLLRPGGRRRWGRIVFAAGLLGLLFFSNHFVSQRLARSLEKDFPAIPELSPGAVPPVLARCQFVVVLGGGHADNPSLPAASQLSPSALARVTEGVRLLRVLPAARLIVTGPGNAGRPTHAALLAQTASALGVDPARIIKVEHVRDTEDEAEAVCQLAGGSPVALVTSAWHLPRAAGLFRRAGVDTLPCPADFLGKSGPGWSWSDFLWDSGSLECSTAAVHEHLGLLWLWLRGRG